MIQEKRKSRYDSAFATGMIDFKVGDWVKVKAPVGHAEWSKFTKPLQVTKLFKNAVKTSDNRIWNKRRVAKCCQQEESPKPSERVKTRCEVQERGLQGSEGTRRSSREVRKPFYLKEYVASVRS